MQENANVTRPEGPPSVFVSAETARETDGERPFVPPRYGHAAAIYVLYQQSPKQRTKPPKPRRPGGGKLVRTLEGVAALLRGLTPAEA